MSIIKENEEYFGDMIHKWNLSHKNKYVITGLQQGGASVDMRIGRVVQVRLEHGDYRSENNCSITELEESDVYTAIEIANKI